MTGHGLEKEWGLKDGEWQNLADWTNKELIVQDQDQVMELKGQIILPGFVNGHNHNVWIFISWYYSRCHGN